MLSKSKLKYIQTLGQKKFRQEEGSFIAEGPKIVGELIRERKDFVVEVYGVTAWMEANPSLTRAVPCTEISEQELERISQLQTPNQVLAVMKQFPNEKPGEQPGLILALDQIQDPGNLGTIIRIADWFGIRQLVCQEGTAEMFNPKVVQATMGSIARVHIFYTDLADWLSGQSAKTIYAAVLEGKSIHSIEPVQEGILLIGNESKGINPDLLSLAHIPVTIPRIGKAESLNAAVATGILLSHLAGHP